MTIKRQLQKADKIQEARGKVYGVGEYKNAGKMFTAILPNGVTLKTEEDFTRFQMMSLCLVKIKRYAQNIENGGHYDSAIDLVNYAAMLSDVTENEDD